MKEAYLDRVDAEDLLSKVPRKPTGNGDTFAGTASCAPCHQQAAHIWNPSLHASAFRTLVKEKEDMDPECVVCHVVGQDRESGFTSHQRTPHLENVGCEDRHVRDPRVRLPRVTSNNCVKCHTTEQSPGFNFETFWPRVKH